MTRVGVALVAFCLLAGPAESAARKVFGVEYVKARLQSLHGKTVRVQGQMNNCQSLTCSICMDASEDAVCLPISFEADNHRADDLIEEAYRFATITVEAKIDATCELGFDPSERSSRDPNEIIVCTDRSRALTGARILSVDIRRSAAEGRFDAYGGDPLARPSAEQRAQVLNGWKAWRKRMAPWDDNELEIEVFAAPPHAEDGESGLALCVCLDDSCKGKWPTMSGHFTRSPGNPYDCWRAELYESRWVFLP